MFNVKTLLTVGLAAVAPLANAWVQPRPGPPTGNAVGKPNSGDIVPAGQTYTITWTPSTAGPITILFLKGPSSNVIPQYAIVEHIANSGSYQWAVPADTPASDPSTPAQGYGIQLIDEKTGEYQYSTQFGISNNKSPSPAPGYPSPAPAPTYGQPTHTASASKTSTVPTTAPTYPAPAPIPAPVPAPANKPYPSGNSTAPAPSTGSNVPAPAPYSPAPAPVPGRPTNGASSMAVSSVAGLVVAAGVAVLAF